MTSQPLEIPGARGAPLPARLDLPAGGQVRAHVLFAHCFGCSQDSRGRAEISDALTREGLAVLHFDFAGPEEVQGEPEGADPASSVGDVLAVARFLEQEHAGPQVLVGHSLGGTAVLLAASRISSARAVATINAPGSAARARAALGGSVQAVGRGVLEELEQSPIQEILRDMRRALLVMHAPTDAVVGIESAAEIFQAARHPKSFVSLHGADHMLTGAGDSRYAAAVIAAWAGRYVDAPAPGPVSALAVGGEHQVAVRTGRERFRTEVRAGPHGLLSDEPAQLGGTDLGPTPYDLLLAALGACTTITLRMYADRKGWPLEEAVVRLRHERRRRADGAGAPDAAERQDWIERVVELSGDLTREQRARLLEIADRCPIHRTLEAGVVTESRLES